MQQRQDNNQVSNMAVVLGEHQASAYGATSNSSETGYYDTSYAETAGYDENAYAVQPYDETGMLHEMIWKVVNSNQLVLYF
jgi:hypothetical protein